MVHSSGSFDRNGHGEEYPKGAFVVDLNQEKKTFKAEFWENKKALPYARYYRKKVVASIMKKTTIPSWKLKMMP